MRGGGGEGGRVRGGGGEGGRVRGGGGEGGRVSEEREGGYLGIGEKEDGKA